MNRMRRITLGGDSDFQPKIVVYRFGKVNDQKVNQIVGIIRECYNRLAPHEVDVLDLYIFERSSTVEAFLAQESRRVGVASSSFDELFFSMHDAWRGFSRIIICQERMKKLATLAQKGGIRHEVGHSVLHGTPFYYIFSIPPSLLDLTKSFRLSRQYMINMLYLISIAVKDYEVSRLLHKHGYAKDQIAFAKHMLTPMESDKTSWEIARARPDTEALCMISHLKLIGYVTPFLTNEDSEKKIKNYIRESLSFLPKKHSAKLLRQTPEIFQQLEMNTLNNISKFTQLIVEKIIQPIFEDEAENKFLSDHFGVR